MHCSWDMNSVSGVGLKKKKKTNNADVDALDVDAAYPNGALGWQLMLPGCVCIVFK